MNKKAVLIFADPLRLDLARCGLPESARPLFNLTTLARHPEADVHLFTSVVQEAPAHVALRLQRGATFAERLERATDEIAALGYEQIVIIGRDCPLLENADIVRAFAGLAHHRLVLGPDHRGGCYLIALSAGDRQMLRGIRWKRNTDCRQLCERAHGRALLLAVKQDVDSWRDLLILARTAGRLGRLLRHLLDHFFSLGEKRLALRVDIARHVMRVRQQMPPPGPAA